MSDDGWETAYETDRTRSKMWFLAVGLGTEEELRETGREWSICWRPALEHEIRMLVMLCDDPDQVIQEMARLERDGGGTAITINIDMDDGRQFIFRLTQQKAA